MLVIPPGRQRERRRRDDLRDRGVGGGELSDRDQVARRARVAGADAGGLDDRGAGQAVRGEPLPRRAEERALRSERPGRHRLGIVARRRDEHRRERVVLRHRAAGRHRGDRRAHHVVLVVEVVVGLAEGDRGSGIVGARERLRVEDHERGDQLADARDRARLVGAARGPDAARRGAEVLVGSRDADRRGALGPGGRWRRPRAGHMRRLDATTGAPSGAVSAQPT